MKNKILKTSIVLIMILTMTASNFIFVGSSLISYAAEEISTNHKNVEAKIYFKNQEGKEVTTLEKETDAEETFLYLHINVKNEGYFNGEVTLENSNFKLKETDSPYVSKIENNTIYLNQINVGATEEIKIKIEPMNEDNINIGLLNMESKMKIKGTYKDRTQRDIAINSQRSITLKLIENNQENNIINDLKIITNKIVTIDNQEKRLVQYSYHMGMEKNNYPIEEIQAKITLPKSQKPVQIETVEYLNNMTKVEHSQNENELTLTLTNKKNSEGNINWKKTGNEEIILTCLYEKEEIIENQKVEANMQIKLYNSKQLERKTTIEIGKEEQNSLIEIQAKNQEEAIYKGKLKAGLERDYQTTSKIRINLAKAVEAIDLKEAASTYTINEKEVKANVTYKQTLLKKDQFQKLLGQKGELTIYDQNESPVAIINQSTPADQDGNLVVTYEEKAVTSLHVKTTKPEAEGILELKHQKTINPSEEIEKVKIATSLNDMITISEKTANSTMKLEDTTSNAQIELNKESLSTVISNNVEIKAVLTSNDEKYDLYKNPQIAINLPEEVENIQINNIEMLYEDELAIKDYSVDGKTINIALEGEQTKYKEAAVQGATILMDTNLNVNKKAATKQEAVEMIYQNGEIRSSQKEIKIVAPTDITAIYSIPELNIETLAQENLKTVAMARGVEEKQLQAQIEIINNNENTIENVKVMGMLPTNNQENNMEIEIIKEIALSKEAKIYYTENEVATDDLQNPENGWSETITNAKKVTKYLILVNSLESGETIQGNYTYLVPENLEYNKVAKTGYQVKYTNSNTKVEGELLSTIIEMQTGVGPKLETKLTATTVAENNKTVKNGEIIHYNIEIANIGTEEIKNVQVKAKVPEGTTLVEPQDKYEYIGAVYYKELENKTYEGIIKQLAVGQTIHVEYEVRVNSKTKAGEILTNQAEVKYGDVIKTTEETKHETKAGNLRVSVKRVTDRSIILYKGNSVMYYAIVENITNQKQQNVKVQTNLPNGLEVEKLTLYTNMEITDPNDIYIVGQEEEEELVKQHEDQYEEEAPIEREGPKTELQKEAITYQKEVNIGDLEPGEVKVLGYEMAIKKASNIDFFVVAKDEKQEYQSNQWHDKIEDITVDMRMETNTNSQYVKSGDTIKYTIKIENNTGAPTNALTLQDTIPESLTINKITKDGEEIEKSEGNDLRLRLTIPSKESTTVEIESVVDYAAARTVAEPITNIAYAEVHGEKVAATSEINHIIAADSQDEEIEEGSNLGNSDIANGKGTITGIAWFDENANGIKDGKENTLSGIKIKLLNTKTNHLVKQANGQTLEATTNENGVYVLDKIGNGSYIAIFEYDQNKYALTKYQVEGSNQAENSNALRGELTIENEKKEVASTDLLNIQDSNLSDINIGLIKLQNFDLQLDKYVSKILIQNANGTTVRQYDNETMAKVELDAKTVNGSTAIIEYQIKVANNGEIAGYAKKIADYVSTELKFNSELNKDWYQVGNTLYTSKLANEIIKPGETKTVTLTLSKSMTEDNTGLIPNTAEIVEDYNDLEIPDSNSTPANRAQGENDLGTAEVLLSIRTGGYIYITLGIVAVIVLGAVTVILIKNKNKQGNEE